MKRKIQSIFCNTPEIKYKERCMGKWMVGYFLRRGKNGYKVISHRQVYVSENIL